MTIENEDKRFAYSGNGSTVAFAYTFRILSDTDLTVVLQSAAGVDTVQALTTNYSVSGVGDAAGGLVTMVVAPVTGETLTVILDPPITQATDYTAGGAFPGQSHENALDRNINVSKRTRDIVERSLALFDGDTDGSGRYDANLNRIQDVTDPVNDQDAATKAYVTAQVAAAAIDPVSATISAFAATVVDDADAPAMFATLDVPQLRPSDPYVIVITGQSNAAGANSGGLNPGDASVLVWDGAISDWGSSDITTTPMSRSTPDGNSADNNVAIARAHYIHDLTGQTVYVVYDAVGGSPITDWVGVGTTRYLEIETKVGLALASTELTGVTKVDEIIWGQGEEDAAVAFATYMTAFTTVMGQFRAESWCDPQTPIYILGMSELHDRHDVAAAQRIYAGRKDARCIFVESRGLVTSDATHWDGVSLWEFGYYRIAEADPRAVEIPHFWTRGDGLAEPFEDIGLLAFKTIISLGSWTSGPSSTSGTATNNYSQNPVDTLVWGLDNVVDGNYCAAFGRDHVNASASQYNLLSGQGNTTTGTGDWSAALGRDHNLEHSYGFAAGRGHTLVDEGMAAVGMFSEHITTQANEVRFQVGTGTSAGVRSNGFAVRDDGICEMKNLPVHANDAAAGVAGMTAGQLYLIGRVVTSKS